MQNTLNFALKNFSMQQLLNLLPQRTRKALQAATIVITRHDVASFLLQLLPYVGLRRAHAMDIASARRQWDKSRRLRQELEPTGPKRPAGAIINQHHWRKNYRSKL